MEQLLNLIWLVVALAIVCAWLRHRRRVQPGPYQVRLIWQVLALSIVLIFLFYSISATDDLNWTEIAAEASEGAKNVVSGLPSSVPAAIPGLYIWALLLLAACLFTARKVGTIERPYSIGLPNAGSRQVLSGRSPPKPF